MSAKEPTTESALLAVPRTENGSGKAIIQMAAEFAAREIAPRVADYDREERFPRDLLERDGRAGILRRRRTRVEVGGHRVSTTSPSSRLIEEISKTCQIIGTLVSMPSGLVGAEHRAFGTHEQQERWLRAAGPGRDLRRRRR